ncbi:BRO family protein [Algoriphagus zhangzhouensis]|uniref:BRO family protein n=1 Tax=Algoriphagus zhangzhouensis TaxID=1073327 RepID=UPI000937F725
MAKDVAELLEYKNTRKAVIDLCKIADSDGVANRDPIGGEKKIQIVPRPDVYRLITKSKLPAV